ncbi:MAG TPA: hypothetical protein VNR17_12550 [Luteimicrobium sp.]|nr:hypothetical protein [Luteimicrobium sp.]
MTHNKALSHTPTQVEAEQAVKALLARATEPSENLVTRFTVAQYVEWRARYDELQQEHEPGTVTKPTVFYDITDETSLAILADVPDLASARAWAQGGWREALPAEGLETPPVVHVGVAPDQVTPGARLGAHFTVYDYPRWHQLFGEMEGSRVRSRITDPQVFRAAEDGSDVLVLWSIEDGELVRSWLVEDLMTGYPAATGAGSAVARFFVEVAADDGQEVRRGN